ncbi:hypothetical protein JKP88DRAFT_244982 [Tribonema minus]|uniref:Uncharacterized protein n=1 Tax=Tribonema minus TaxID=303371 RepID=A0A835YYT2_9STRA|nr:hypothetical protein JKP88DRAFT_244982 [Tribonema minus]
MSAADCNPSIWESEAEVASDVEVSDDESEVSSSDADTSDQAFIAESSEEEYSDSASDEEASAQSSGEPDMEQQPEPTCETGERGTPRVETKARRSRRVILDTDDEEVLVVDAVVSDNVTPMPPRVFSPHTPPSEDGHNSAFECASQGEVDMDETSGDSALCSKRLKEAADSLTLRNKKRVKRAL